MLNWREVHLLLSELPLVDSYIQKVTEHDFHSFTLSLFHREEKAWLLYVESGTKDARFCRTDRIRRKSDKAQRFTQYMRSHLVGARITDVIPFPYDRAFILVLERNEERINLLFRFYSGSGANIMVLDGENRIEELLFRRPARGEVKGEEVTIEFRESEGDRTFEVRPYEGDSFNEWIDRYYQDKDREESRELYIERIIRKRDRELSEIRSSISGYEKRLKVTEHYDESRKLGDLMSANLHRMKKGMDSVTLEDWETGNTVTVALDPKKDPKENLLSLYDRYQKDRKTHEKTLQSLESEKELLEERSAHYLKLLEPDVDLGRLRRESQNTPSEKTQERKYHGLEIESHGFTLIVGRNSRENDQILRHDARGNDYWMHTRDYSGGYVVMKVQRGKSVPLEVLLDAANLAIHYSRAKKEGRADLYYTEVKYLRRAKNGKEGLVLPTQERNLHVVLDEDRVRKLIGKSED